MLETSISMVLLFTVAEGAFENQANGGIRSATIDESIGFRSLRKDSVSPNNDDEATQKAVREDAVEPNEEPWPGGSAFVQILHDLQSSIRSFDQSPAISGTRADFRIDLCGIPLQRRGLPEDLSTKPLISIDLGMLRQI
jgi:hypothetical protein